MSEKFRVRISHDELGFCAAHFISYDGDHCERLHGHNYSVSIEVAGSLDANSYVFDFIALKNLAREITGGFDHRLLLPSRNHYIQVSENDDQVEVRYHERRWSFPRGDCMLLPVENTTAELLAQFVALRLTEELEQRFRFRPDSVQVALGETTGQAAIFEMTSE
jgi:6-pyruvoyltetrahydropterin/6-carboxytetrahydropterin synthase